MVMSKYMIRHIKEVHTIHEAKKEEEEEAARKVARKKKRAEEAARRVAWKAKNEKKKEEATRKSRKRRRAKWEKTYRLPTAMFPNYEKDKRGPLLELKTEFKPLRASRLPHNKPEWMPESERKKNVNYYYVTNVRHNHK
jgi:hypothetical protein